VRQPLSPVCGVYAALATPRASDSIEADAAALFDYLDAIVRARVNGLVLFGSTGEFVHFDLAERIRVLTLAIKRCKVPLLVNVSHSSFTGVRDLAENAIDTGASGLLLMPPYFFRYSDEQIFSFYMQFASVIDRRAPVYLYNAPQFTNPLSVALASKLLSTGAFAGIKDSGGDWPMFEALRALRPKLSFQIFVGNDSLYSRAVPLGADGVVSGVAAALPELMVSLDRALRANDSAKSSQLDVRLQEFLAWVNKFPATIAIKRAAVARGWKLNHASVPFDERTSSDIGAFESWFREWLPVILADASA
jgi:dihydrodipicolinate synthase/N-acetylneuraminate lyase